MPPKDLSPSIAEHRARVAEHLARAQELARAKIQRAQQRMKLHYDQHSSFPAYELGLKVWIYTPKTKKALSKKLRHNWHGPMRIYKKMSPVTYKVKLPNNSRIATTIHVNRIKPYYDPDERPISPPAKDDPSAPYLHENELPDDSFESPADSALSPPTVPSADCDSAPQPPTVLPGDPDSVPMEIDATPDEELPSGSSASRSPSDALLPEVPSSHDIYQVEHILKECVRQGKPQFYVKWLGYSSRHNTWEPEENILDPRLIVAFHARKSVQSPRPSASIASLSAVYPQRQPLGMSSRAAYNPSKFAVFFFSFVYCICLTVIPFCSR